MGKIVSSNMLSLSKINNTNELSNQVFQPCENQVSLKLYDFYNLVYQIIST